MSISAKQLKDNIIVPSLKAIDLCSDAAVNLLLGTAAQESHLGTYIKQINGPALGIYQMEPRTYDDIFDNYLKFRPAILNKIFQFCHYASKPDASYLSSNLLLATILTRLHYFRIGETLPDPNNISGLAIYWKKYYNTSLGKGTTEEFINNYKKYVI